MPLTVNELKELGIELNEEQLTAINDRFQAELDTTVSGLKNKRDELLGAQKQLKEKLGRYDGLDAEQAREAIKKQQEMSDKKLIDEGKLEELVAQRAERMKESYEKQLADVKAEADNAKTFVDKFRSRVLSDEIRATASQLGVIPSAIEDAIYRSKELFSVDDEGKVIPTEKAGLDDKGNILTPKAWLEVMRDKAPHWFSVPQGTGAQGSNVGKATLNRSKMNAQEKMVYITKHGQQAFLQLPK